MAKFKLIQIPAEDYDALGLSPETLLETYITEDGALVIRKVSNEDLKEFVCNGDCNNCPVAELDCDGDCLACPCYACCDNSNYIKSKKEVN